MISSLTKAYWDTNSPIYKISQKKLIKKGIKCLLIDVDGTLLSRNTDEIPLQVKEWMKESTQLFKLYLISNNPSEKRISKVGDELGVKYKFRALKPKRKSTLEVISIMNENNKNIAIIGDRIFTDIVVGNRCNIKTILVKRLNNKGMPLKFNLTLSLEKLLSLFLF